ncbi:sensor histidine kinase [Paenibacillus agricola]|uniref:histidine kinase n=1 Tax=Paenibacillus agricola TaxID=2716264 RepID=A0ABX0J8W0_9BACL|nr:PAS domain-containing sensor histidine kinase [Paenibacillus agricola]NHN32804.1 PAS domain S-box protein [Paenibacillus agricola]
MKDSESLAIENQHLQEEVNQLRKRLSKSENKYRQVIEQSRRSMDINSDYLIEYLNPAGLRALGASCRIENYNRFDKSFQLAFNDMIHRKQLEESLMKSEETYRRLVELSPEPVLVHQDGIFLYMNKAALKLLGGEQPCQFIGQSIWEYLSQEYLPMLKNRMERILDGEETDLTEFVIIRMDGKLVYTESRSSLIYVNGKPSILTCLRDITLRKKNEELREEKQQKLRYSEERYYRLQRSLDRFSRDVLSVVNVGELERRLIKEVKKILKVDAVAIVECTPEGILVRCGLSSLSKRLEKALNAHNQMIITANALFHIHGGWFEKIGERQGNNIYLCIDESAEILMVQPKQVWLQTLARYVHVLYDNFLVIDNLSMDIEQIVGQPEAPPWMLRMQFTLSENERKRLSQDLHDSALQEQIVHYRQLEAIINDFEFDPPIAAKLEEIKEGLLDVIYQIRLTCNELRPPLLQEFGLVASLESLVQAEQLRNDYVIRLTANYPTEHSDDLTVAIYRIVQELLSNASKHSNATEVTLRLNTGDFCISLDYEDNGIGLNLDNLQNTYHSMGVYGIRERIRSLNGTISFSSAPNNGLKIGVKLPTLLEIYEKKENLCYTS